MSLRSFLNLFTASALLGGLAFWPAACASQRLFSQARSGAHASQTVPMADGTVPAGPSARAAQSDPGKPEPHTGGSRRQSAAGLTLWKDRGLERSSVSFNHHRSFKGNGLGEARLVSAQGTGLDGGTVASSTLRPETGTFPGSTRGADHGRGNRGASLRILATAAANVYEVTAYSFGCTLPRNGVEPPPQRGADGRWPRADITVAADTSVHPFGTELLIEGIGFRTVGDRGHAIKGRKLDLFVDSCAEARRFGRRWLRVHAVPSETTLEGAN